MTDQPTSIAPLAADLPSVQGRCPACGGESLMLADGGYVTCRRLDCPRPDLVNELIGEIADSRQHGAFVFCGHHIGYATMREFATKITEKVTAVAQRAEAVAYANEQKQRAEAADAAVDRVSAECHRIETAVRANPTAPDFDGAYLAAIKHIRTALAEPKEADA